MDFYMLVKGCETCFKGGSLDGVAQRSTKAFKYQANIVFKKGSKL